MRQIGTLQTETDARRLADHLLTLNITTRIDQTQQGWAVWVHREERVSEAKRELDQFLQNPSDPRYEGVEQTAKAIRKRAYEEEQRHIKNTISLSGRWNYRPADRCPLTLGLIAACVLVAVLSNLGSSESPVLPRMFIADLRLERVVVGDDPGGHPVIHPRFAVSGNLEEIRHGEVWRLITPIFIHFGALHLVFNMIWLYELGGLIELRRGTLRLALLVLATGIVSNLGEFYYTHIPYFGGMSGVVYGLFGYIWTKTRYEPGSGLSLRPNTVSIMLIWLVVCMAGIVGPVANAAHLVGLAVGLLVGFAPHAPKEFRKWVS